MNRSNKDLVFVLSTYVGEFGGIAKATLLLCEALVDCGKQVRLFTPFLPDPAVQQRLKIRNIEIVSARFGGGCRWGLPSKIIAWQLFQEARYHKPALIHVVSLSYEGRYLLKLPFVAPVYLWESTEALPHVHFVDPHIHKYLHRAAAILAPSQTIARNVRETYNFGGQVNILPFWADAPLKVASNTSRPRNNNFACIGRVDLDKGFRYLFEAFREVQTRYPTATLTICGGGEIETVKQLASDIPGIEIRGFVSSEEYEQVVAHCDAVVLASLHEGYPLALLEACGRHTPIVATTVGSIPEVFGERNCALLVPPRDSVALAAAMKQILSEDDPTYSERCADAAQLFETISSPAAVRRYLMEAYSPSDNSVQSTAGPSVP